MARIRSTKPEFWHDRKLARSCSRDARMLYMGLWNYADEHARMNGDPAVLKGEVFPYDDIDIVPLVLELAAIGRVQPYAHEGDPFLFLPKLAEHQRLEPAKVTSKFPDLPTEFPDPTTVFSDSHNGEPSVQVTAESEKTCAESARNPRESSLLYVAGSMEHDGKSASAEPPRADVERVCTRLVEVMLAKGCRKPNITTTWRDEARHLIDLDKRPLAEILAIIAFALDDPFWKKNIHSVPTLRRQYDKLRLAMEESRRGAKVGNGVYDDDEEVWMR